MFKYQKTDQPYVGYSFLKSSFVDKFNIDHSIYGLSDSLVKLTYYMTVKSIDFFRKFGNRKQRFNSIILIFKYGI